MGLSEHGLLYKVRIWATAGCIACTMISVNAAVLIECSFEEQGTSSQYAKHWEWGNPDYHGGVFGSASRENWRAYSGEWEATIRGTWADAGDHGGWWRDARAEEGDRIHVSAYFWADSEWTSPNQFLKLEFIGSDGELIHDYRISTAGVGEEWVQLSVSGEAPADTTWARVVVEAFEVGTDGALQFDDVLMRRQGGQAIPEAKTMVLLGLGVSLLLAGRRVGI